MIDLSTNNDSDSILLELLRLQNESIEIIHEIIMAMSQRNVLGQLLQDEQKEVMTILIAFLKCQSQSSVQVNQLKLYLNQMKTPIRFMMIHQQSLKHHQMKQLILEMPAAAAAAEVEEAFVAAPGQEKKPVSGLNYDFCEKLANPHLFPRGRYDYKVERDAELTPSKYFNQRLLNFLFTHSITRN